MVLLPRAAMGGSSTVRMTLSYSLFLIEFVLVSKDMESEPLDKESGP